MPLVRFDVIEGRSPGEFRTLLDTAHMAVVDAWGIPERDRYQIVHIHPADAIVALDTGLAIERSAGLVIVSTGRTAGREAGASRKRGRQQRPARLMRARHVGGMLFFFWR